ncbi:hypothetical protein [Streptomyces sp. RM99]|uniref:hypothetical protein n=1 Tax=Streptomyces sp. RM99 TaxID=2824897 RepID=UPI0027DB4EF5|nr:hypothetical protein [Streptomyces sp. RM99]
MDLSFFQSETAQRLRAEGRAEGRAERIQLLLDHRGVEVSEEERARIAGCTDMGALDAWFVRAIAASSVAEVFGPEGD